MPEVLSSSLYSPWRSKRSTVLIYDVYEWCKDQNLSHVNISTTQVLRYLGLKVGYQTIQIISLIRKIRPQGGLTISLDNI